MDKRNDALRLAREALETVEAVFNADEETECAWCRVEAGYKSWRSRRLTVRHADDCLRQLALAAIDEAMDSEWLASTTSERGGTTMDEKTLSEKMHAWDVDGILPKSRIPEAKALEMRGRTLLDALSALKFLTSQLSRLNISRGDSMVSAAERLGLDVLANARRFGML